MEVATETLELYGQSVVISEPKVLANQIKRAFSKLANEWSEKVESNFYEMFSGLQDLYESGDSLGHTVRVKALEEGIKIITANGIYDIDEERFYDDFMSQYDDWDEDFGVLAEKYEAILDRTAAIDAHRTHRRQNRRMWVGYGTERAVQEADGKNIVNNVTHGVFNMLAKGVTAIGDSLKKDQIFKDPSTVQLVVQAVTNLVTAAYLATVDAINSEYEGKVHSYESDELKKAHAITSNLEKGNIPKESVIASAVRAIGIYPYSRSLYTILLRDFGADEGRLDQVVAFFGMDDLNPEKSKLFETRLNECSIKTESDLNSARTELEGYASQIGYLGAAEHFDRIRAKQQSVQPTNSLQLEQLTASEKRTSAITLEAATQGMKSDKNINFYVAPDLPLKKINAFMIKSTIAIPPKEVVFYFDETIFGSGDNGVMIDRSHIYINVPFCDDKCVPLADISTLKVGGLLNKKITITTSSGKKIEVALTQSNKGAEKLAEAIEGLINLLA
ncbi:hypothetical protein [Aquipseudomonas alcaligenes]|uniref:hypothetical protein n=1 Tax=Aquipseudomonas alcaligenes TaxID=43263 RepID=UPI0036492A43